VAAGTLTQEPRAMNLDPAKLRALEAGLAMLERRIAAIEARAGVRRADDANWNEADHPRAEDGKFGSGAGKAKSQPAAAKAGEKASAEPKGKAEAKPKPPPRQEGPSQVPTTGRAASHASTKVADGKRLMADGSPLPAHVAAAKIPPNWQSVTVDTNPKAELIAAGKDAKGRPTAIYSAAFVDKQQAAKFSRVQALDKAFAGIKAKNDAAMRSNDARTKAAADCTDLIMKMGLRPGSDADTGAKVKAYGASNLLGEHVAIDGNDVRLKFVGKKGVNLDLPVTDPGLQAMLTARAKEAGPTGKLFGSLNEAKLGEHVKAIGGKFKTKDFRTLLGTRTAASLVKPPPPTSEKEYHARAMEVAKQVSAKLGNTPVVALQSYINPAVFASWRISMSSGQKPARGDAAAEPASEAGAELPDAFFGSADAPPAAWDEDDTADDDEELAENPPGLVAMLGFDPKAA
jgi:DNA topoisomerase-1